MARAISRAARTGNEATGPAPQSPHPYEAKVRGHLDTRYPKPWSNASSAGLGALAIRDSVWTRGTRAFLDSVRRSPLTARWQCVSFVELDLVAQSLAQSPQERSTMAAGHLPVRQDGARPHQLG